MGHSVLRTQIDKVKADMERLDKSTRMSLMQLEDFKDKGSWTENLDTKEHTPSRQTPHGSNEIQPTELDEMQTDARPEGMMEHSQAAEIFLMQESIEELQSRMEGLEANLTQDVQSVLIEHEGVKQ